MFQAHTHLTPFLTHDCRLSATNPQWHWAWEELDLETPFAIQVNSLILCAHPTAFFLELGASSMRCDLSIPTSSSWVHKQTTLRWGRARVCISHCNSYNIFSWAFCWLNSSLFPFHKWCEDPCQDGIPFSNEVSQDLLSDMQTNYTGWLLSSV